MRKYLATATAAAAVLAFGVPAAQAGIGGEQPPVGVVSSTPVSNTPHLKAASNNPIQEIRQLVQCGNTMYGVGTFNTIVKGSTTYTRNNVFSFKAAAPYTVTGWAPNIVGTYGTISNSTNTVNTIAFANGDCSHAYIGGQFTSVNGTAVKNIAEVDTTTGNVVTAFAARPRALYKTMLGAGTSAGRRQLHRDQWAAAPTRTWRA